MDPPNNGVERTSKANGALSGDVEMRERNSYDRAHNVRDISRVRDLLAKKNSPTTNPEYAKI